MHEQELQTRLVETVRQSPVVMQVLRTARKLDLPDWLLVSGAIYQTVWNHLTGRDLSFGIKDYDLFYFDSSDTSYEAEDVVIRRVTSAFESPLRERVEVRNQARVHLWFPAKHDEEYPPLARSAEALTRFVATAFAVGVRLQEDDRLIVEAPFGLSDLFEMRLCPNPSRTSKSLERIVDRIRARWPEIRVEL